MVAARIKDIDPVDHGTALSIYFPDPEGNRIEIYMATPWYIKQPHRQLIDFNKSDVELLKACEKKCQSNPSFMSIEAWKTKFRAKEV